MLTQEQIDSLVVGQVLWCPGIVAGKKLSAILVGIDEDRSMFRMTNPNNEEGIIPFVPVEVRLLFWLTEESCPHPDEYIDSSEDSSEEYTNEYDYSDLLEEPDPDTWDSPAASNLFF